MISFYTILKESPETQLAALPSLQWDLKARKADLKDAQKNLLAALDNYKNALAFSRDEVLIDLYGVESLTRTVVERNAFLEYVQNYVSSIIEDINYYEFVISEIIKNNK